MNMTKSDILLFRMFDSFRAAHPGEEEAARELILKASAALKGCSKGGKKGGAAKSEAKAQAVRENGKKGGRPPEPKQEFMILFHTASTSHPTVYRSCTLRGAHAYAKELIKEYEPDCRYTLKTPKEDAEGWEIWETVFES